MADSPQVTGGQSTRRPVRLVLLLVGFLALTIGMVFARAEPASGYEVSIYAATPTGYWIGLAVAYGAVAAVIVGSYRNRLGAVALFLGGIATLSFVSLPLIRGYRYHGLADALTHLGWVDGMYAGDLAFNDLLYPASHSSIAGFARLAGISTEHASLLYITLLAGLFLLFVPLSAYAVTRHRRVLVIGAFAGFLLLPITNVETMLHYHTYTLTVFFLPAFVFSLVRYLTSDGGRRLGVVTLNRWSAMVAILGLGLLLLHPQVMANVLVLLAAIALLQIGYRLLPRDRLAPIQPVYAFAGVFGIAWFLWLQTASPEVFGVAERVIDSVIGVFIGEAAPGETVTGQAESLATVGGNVVELFMKLFFIPALVGLLAAYAAICVVFKRPIRPDVDTERVVLAFTVAGIVFTPFLLLHYAGAMSHLFFRHLGFVFALASIFGAVGLHLALASSWVPQWPSITRPAVMIVVLVVLVASLLVVFPSPYIYNQNHHVTDQAMTGYQAAFDYADSDVPFADIRSSTSRFESAIVPMATVPSVPSFVSGEAFHQPTDDREAPFYLAISQVDIDREVIAYAGLRFADADFDALAAHPQVDTLIDGGEFWLYRVTPPQPG